MIDWQDFIGGFAGGLFVGSLIQWITLRMWSRTLSDWEDSIANRPEWPCLHQHDCCQTDDEEDDDE
jgi:hypothetical protein